MAVRVSRLVTKFSHSGCVPKILAFRNMSVVSAKTLLYKEYGEPVKVLEFATDQVNKPEGSQVWEMYYCMLITIEIRFAVCC